MLSAVFGVVFLIFGLQFNFSGDDSLYFVNQVLAQENNQAATPETYETKEVIPGEAEGTSDFITYLGMLYRFGIAIVAILSVVMIAIGAFTYIVTSAGNAAKIADAKSMIKNAIIGLVIALVAWLALFVVNPDLVRGRMDLSRVTNERLPFPEGVCEEKQNGDTAPGCRYANGTERHCWGGECVEPCRNDDGSLWSDNTHDPRCGTDAFYVCYRGSCVAFEAGEECGPLMGVDGSRLGVCQSDCSGDLTQTTDGKKCEEGMVCCVSDDSFNL